jgi:hypothetical protein
MVEERQRGADPMDAVEKRKNGTVQEIVRAATEWQ